MLEQGQADRRRKRNALIKVLLQAASLTFLAEWGDRSQLATVVLATRENAVGVVVGGSLGHALCTGLAVIGGRMVAQKISVRTGKLYDHSNLIVECLGRGNDAADCLIPHLYIALKKLSWS